MPWCASKRAKHLRLRQAHTISRSVALSLAQLVFDEAEGLFGTRGGDGSAGASRHDTINVGVLLHHLENYSGTVRAHACTRAAGTIARTRARAPAHTGCMETAA
jgi:hypothetical protein